MKNAALAAFFLCQRARGLYAMPQRVDAAAIVN